MKLTLLEYRKQVEEALARVKGTSEQPNIGEDFVALLEQAEQLKKENEALEVAIQNQELVIKTYEIWADAMHEITGARLPKVK